MFDTILAPFNAIAASLQGVIDFFTNPLWGWFVIGAGIFVACIMLGWFFPRLREALGVIVVATGGFLAGAVKMYLRLKDRDRNRRGESE